MSSYSLHNSSSEGNAAPGTESMDRAHAIEAMQDTLGSCESMEIRHYRRGWVQEFFCCITRSDFKYFNEGKKVATSTEDFGFVCRCCFGPCHSFDMSIKDTATNHDFLEINRPFRCCMGTTKCCCRQEAAIFNGDDHLGDIQETCWCCVPHFKVHNEEEDELYIIRPPTCCGNMCINCCPNGKSPCPHGCCMIPCDIYPIQNGAEGIGTMAKIPKETFKETFNEINYYKIDFPKDATTREKGLLLGSSILINALYFEHSE
eukprot:jgi/Psemu1/254252/estExt_Genewise1Plus.C_930119